MRFSVPHPVPYQGSKRRLATAILSYVPANRYTRLVEPFAGSAAVTLAAASRRAFSSYVVGDALEPLVRLWELVIHDPNGAAERYATLWHRERRKPIDEYYAIRSEFNLDRDPVKLLYLLARCVKNAVRFNPAGEFNQSPDKRRTGTRPELMKAELSGAHRILAGKCQARARFFPTKAGAGFMASARTVLERLKAPLTCREIVRRASAEGVLDGNGRMPEKTLYALLSRDIRSKGDRSKFRKVGPGQFILARKIS